MKVVFISNYYNHHQSSFSVKMSELTGGEYWFIATEKMSDERKAMGWGKEVRPSFVLQIYESDTTRQLAEDLINSADIVIFGLSGWSNFKLIRPRLKAKKITFRYSERLYKTGLPWYRIPIQAIKLWLTGGRYCNMYLLCASAYAAQDYARTGTYIDKTYKWGYFPETKEYDLSDLMSGKLSVTSGWKHPQVSILWAGRLIEWKHPDVSIELAASLKEKGYSFRMSIIGNGEMEQQLHNMIEEKGLTDCVEMLGAMSPEMVRKHMEKADIFLFTSDFNEGWGAVLNESMNSGCAVVASHAIGAVPFLIQNGKNGLIYENGNQQHMEKQVCSLLDNMEYRVKLGLNAYHTIRSQWNADVAAERLICLCSNLCLGKKANGLYSNGPCSEEERIENDWFSK